MRDNEYQMLYGKNFCYEGKTVDNKKMSAIVAIVCVCDFFIIAFSAYQGVGSFAVVFLLTFFTFAVILLFANKKVINSRREIFLDQDGTFYLITFGMSEELSKQLLLESALAVLGGGGVDKKTRHVLETENQRAQMDAKRKDRALYYIERYKQGFSDYHSIYGGKARVVPLEGFRMITRGKRSSLYVYMKNGKQRKIRLSNDFTGLADYMEVRREVL